VARAEQIGLNRVRLTLSPSLSLFEASRLHVAGVTKLISPSCAFAGIDQTVEVARGLPLLTFSSAEILPWWRYDDRGIDLGSSWRAPTFDDSDWKTGRELFYGWREAPGVTEIPVQTPLSLTNEFGLGPVFTAYFRTTFELPSGIADKLVVLEYIVDDGAVFYINGQEVHRVGMEAGVEPVYGDLAVREQGMDQFFEAPVLVPSEAFDVGENTMAVQVHQAAPDSEDMAFAVSLRLIYECGDALAALELTRDPSDPDALILRVTGNPCCGGGDWHVQAAPTPLGPWETVLGSLFCGDRVQIQADEGGFYRLSSTP
jgi:hypothetical protein